MKNIIFFVILVATNFPLSGQIPIQLNGGRQSEDEISLEDLYIEANQKKILNKYEDAIKIYKRILDRNEINASVYHDLARIYLSLEDSENAVAAGKKAVRYDRSNHWYQLTLAQIYEETIQHSEAAEILKGVIQMVPDESLYHRMATNLDLAEKKMEAIEVYNEADKRYGWDEYRSDSKVDLYLSLNKKKEALNEVKKWSDKYPNKVEYQVKLARYYEYQDRLKKSIETYKKVLRLDPSHEEALYKTKDRSTKDQSGIAVMVDDSRIGIDNKIKSILPLLTDPSNLPEIVPLCQSLINQYPENAKSYALYGDVLWLSGDAVAAVPQYEQALDINKSVYEVWEQLLMALKVTSNYERLESLSEEAMDYYPNQAAPYHYQAIALASKGDLDGATSSNEEALFIAQAGNEYIKDQAQLLKASMLDLQGKTKDAIDYIESLASENRTAGLQELLGDFYIKVGDKGNAEQAWAKSIEMGGDKERIGLKIQSI